ncbi:sterol desaturase/sphingolipid hydroxylase (fatty acid hydroxylase superfamily) [Panacagrimonas perspica]|uniref:Sterol desaturase/sphingolipid hydroxylase (Fatty acid hydroxylase superfamily) n=1 Tax=Panacagrimonas perspica TaxID=381431 RepID=A0A4S3JYK3_9GAMM|nr:sterol desaturase family protein [Panacagrimonas perspica]TDU28156.1 sterol desaturase/sphingolipid hydroxylase (fatty acid hydroxylase superfamily) [Panacagrimonas perspica]THD00653.1 hypothetical protein B1810_23910 [Panacagrimonas perspica]
MSTPLLVAAVALAMMLVEWIAPGRRWPAIRSWWPRALAANAVQAGVVLVAGLSWDRWMQGRALFEAGAGGIAAGAAIGYFTITFVYYWWHRARHEIPWLWRHLHQFHHSASRIEILTSFYKHPAEMLANSVLSSAILFHLLGLDPATGALVTLITGLAELFYHWNIRTPRWLGFFVQRPESHCVHHQEGRHRNNFSDLPLWDALFGTLENPHRFTEPCGLGQLNELRVSDLLRGVDVTRTPR